MASYSGQGAPARWGAALETLELSHGPTPAAPFGVAALEADFPRRRSQKLRPLASLLGRRVPVIYVLVRHLSTFLGFAAR